MRDGDDGTIGRTQGDGVMAILRQTLARSGADGARMHDQIDCADLALEVGHPDVARLLYEVAFLRGGFAPGAVRAQARIAARTRLWDAADWGRHAAIAPRTGFSLERTVRTLVDLMALDGDPPPPVGEPSPADALAAELPLPGPPAAEVPAPLDARAVAALSSRLCEALRGGDVVAVADALDRIAADVLDRPPFLIGDFAAAPVFDLAAAVAFNALRAFFLLNHDLCWAPFGSPAVFAAAARLEDGGLGPYLTNVRNLIRSSRDLFGLIQRAGGGERARLERWLVVLATHLDHDSRVALADEAGDRGLTTVLQGLLTATRRTPDRGTYPFWAIRDAALDLGEIALAAEAQAAITGLSYNRGTEWVVLAEILGTGGGAPHAETALIEALRLSPIDLPALERLDALREGRFEQYHVLHGFGTPPWRIALRTRSRAQAREPSVSAGTGAG